MAETKLTAACVPTIDRTAGPNGRRKVLTRIFIRRGEAVIAERVIPGKWTPAQAVTEYKRFPLRFTHRPQAA